MGLENRRWFALWAVSVAACQPVTINEMASGFDIYAVRPPLNDNGEVGVVRATEIAVTDGTTSTSVQLGRTGLQVMSQDRPVQIGSGGDVVFIAVSSAPPGCISPFRGVYHSALSGGPLTTLFEGCSMSTGAQGIVSPELALSPGGTVAFTQLINGDGAVYRGPAAGPVSVVRSGSGTFYTSRRVDVNDAGQTAVGMEYFDGFQGGLMRGVPVFDAPEPDKEDTLFALEKLGVGSLTRVAINNAGTVALVVPHAFSLTFDESTTAYEGGVYTSTPTLFNTPSSLTLVAGTSHGYCGFGAVDINDAGTVVFEANTDIGSGCGEGGNYDGIYSGPDPVADRVVTFASTDLLGHQFYDSIHMGDLNSNDQVSFTTTYSEPLVEPIKVWRADLL